MNDNKVENLIQKAKEASLRPEEKSSLRFALLEKINSTPIPTPFWSFTFIKTYHYIPATLVVLFVLGGGTSFLAQNALPGDVLYPMKLSVNESIESSLAFGDKESAEVEAIQATRRLEEAEVLASEGLLTVKQNNEIKASFSKKVNSLNQKLGKLSDKGDEDGANEVLNKFDTNVKVKVNQLSEVSKKANNSHVSEILTFIKDNHEEDGLTRVADVTLMMTTESDMIVPEPEADAPTMMMQTNISTTTSTTSETKATNTKSKKTQNKKANIRVMWSWRDNDRN